jgi:agmatine deiminase
MIPNSQNTTVYFSSLLKQQIPTLTANLEKELYSQKIAFSYLTNTKDIWCRDFMPIQIGKNEFVLFNYFPSYLKGASNLRTDNTKVCEKHGISYIFSPIILDGGNVVKLNEKAILTDRIFTENKTKIGDSTLLNNLEKLLNAEIIIIPTEVDDVVGHADGMVRFLDNKTVLVNDYSKTDSKKSFQKKLYSALVSNNLEIVFTPYFPDEKWFSKNKYDIAPATGVYMNFLQVGETIFLPQFSIPQDKTAVNFFSNSFNVIKIDCKELAQYGGLLNCISWEIN